MSVPTLLSPQTIRSGRAPRSRADSRRLASTRWFLVSVFPGWTSATVTYRTGGTSALRAKATGPAASATATPAAPAARTAIPRASSRIAMPVFAATRAKLISQTPPTAARASTSGCCHWLVPSTSQGPPKPCQERAHSVNTQ